MNILDIAKHTVKSFPGSYVGMGEVMGISPNVLRNKVSKSNDTHHLTLIEAIELMEQARDAGASDPIALLRAVAHEFGFQLVREGQVGAGDMSMAESLIEVSRHASSLCIAAVQAIDDGHVDEAERADIAQKRLNATRAIAELEQAVLSFSSPAVVRDIKKAG